MSRSRPRDGLDRDRREAERTPRLAAALFPASYAIHLFEEYFAGSGFPAWAERALGIRFSEAELVTWNAAGLTLMCVGAVLAASHQRYRAIEIAMSIAVLGNAAAHSLASLVTWTYSPGLLTGLFVWLPFGLLRLRAAYRHSSPAARVTGVWLGVLVIGVMLAVLAWGVESRAVSAPGG